jgi:hypothetical protein
MRSVCLILVAVLGWAAEPLGQWRFGTGTIDGRPAEVGTKVLAGQMVAAGNEAPMRLSGSEAPEIICIFAAGSRGSFTTEQGPDGPLLVLSLEQGAVQVEVGARGPYAGVRVRGAAVEVSVTGTLFIVERRNRETDFVALINGRLRVGLRNEVARTVGRNDAIDLTDRRGVSADTGRGLGTGMVLDNRPQLNLGVQARPAVADQASGAAAGGTRDWTLDLAQDLTAGPATAGGSGDLFAAFAGDLLAGFSDLGLPPTATGDTTTAAVSDGNVAAVLPIPLAPAVIPHPPAPPPGP